MAKPKKKNEKRGVSFGYRDSRWWIFHKGGKRHYLLFLLPVGSWMKFRQAHPVLRGSRFHARWGHIRDRPALLGGPDNASDIRSWSWQKESGILQQVEPSKGPPLNSRFLSSGPRQSFINISGIGWHCRPLLFPPRAKLLYLRESARALLSAIVSWRFSLSPLQPCFGLTLGTRDALEISWWTIPETVHEERGPSRPFAKIRETGFLRRREEK